MVNFFGDLVIIGFSLCLFISEICFCAIVILATLRVLFNIFKNMRWL